MHIFIQQFSFFSIVLGLLVCAATIFGVIKVSRWKCFTLLFQFQHFTIEIECNAWWKWEKFMTYFLSPLSIQKKELALLPFLVLVPLFILFLIIIPFFTEDKINAEHYGESGYNFWTFTFMLVFFWLCK